MLIYVLTFFSSMFRCLALSHWRKSCKSFFNLFFYFNTIYFNLLFSVFFLRAFFLKVVRSVIFLSKFIFRFLRKCIRFIYWSNSICLNSFSLLSFFICSILFRFV